MADSSADIDVSHALKERILNVGQRLTQACADGDLATVVSILDTTRDSPPGFMLAVINMPHIAGVSVYVDPKEKEWKVLPTWDSTYEHLITPPLDNSKANPMHSTNSDRFRQLEQSSWTEITASTAEPLTPLSAAFLGGHVDIVRRLVLDNRCDVNITLSNAEMSEVAQRAIEKHSATLLPLISGNYFSSIQGHGKRRLIEEIVLNSRLNLLISAATKQRQQEREARLAIFLRENPSQQATIACWDGRRNVSRTLTIEELKEKEEALEHTLMSATLKKAEMETEYLALEMLKAITSAGPLELSKPHDSENLVNLPLNIVRLNRYDGKVEAQLNDRLPILEIAITARLPSVVKYLLVEGACHVFWKFLEPQFQRFDAILRIGTVLRGLNPLHMACFLNLMPLVQMLLSLRVSDLATFSKNRNLSEQEKPFDRPLYAIDERTRDSNNWTPLYIAGMRSSSDVVDYLLSLDNSFGKPQADVNEQVDGHSLLHHACKRGHIPTIKALLQHGADVNLKVTNVPNPTATPLISAQMVPTSRDGWTALHFAAQQSKLDAIEVLIDHGADLAADARTSKAVRVYPIDCVPRDPVVTHLFDDVSKLLSQL